MLGGRSHYRAIGDIVGALAVFISLVHLALQIRQNTRAVLSSALDFTVNTISIDRQSIYETDEVARVYLKGLAAPGELDYLERFKFRPLIHNLMLSQSNIVCSNEILRSADLGMASSINHSQASTGLSWRILVLDRIFTRI